MPGHSPPPTNPVLVELRRGAVVESFHRGAVAVASPGGLIEAVGDCARPVYPRSALKPVQALPLVESGACAAFGLGSEELALAAASHSGAAHHTDRVAAWLIRLGLDQSALECGAHPPGDSEAARLLAASGRLPSPLHNNCSGKHTGFLTLARHLGIPTAGYIRRDHPVQALVEAVIAEMSGCDLGTAPCGIDGCGIPVFGLPLGGLAAAMARLADPARLPPARRMAAAAIVAAMAAHPELVAGPGRACTEMMARMPGIVLKGGAEGVYVAIVPSCGLGVAVKIDDGAGRAAEVAIAAALVRLGLVTAEAAAPFVRPPLLNVAGRTVGEMVAVEVLAAS